LTVGLEAHAGRDPLLAMGRVDAGFPSDVSAAPRAFADYELLEEIARGGMGVVYKGRQKSLNRIVAIKMILAGHLAGKQITQRFRGEAAAAGTLQHPNIVAIHEIGMYEGQHFFSMDYVAGQNLAQLVGHRPLPPAQAARYVQIIAEAMHYAHEQGILHRDVKPSNVLIDAATDQPRITDFGLARRLDGDSSLTLTGQVLGSPNFMPPEQASRSHGKVGRHSDVYGLGSVLYYLLTARAPFQGESLEAILTQVINAEPVRPRLLNPAVPPDLETVCLKCLEKEPSRRYKTAHELAEELGRFLKDEPILARPVTRVERTWRWCRRKPVVAGLAAAVILALGLGLAGVLWQWRRAELNAASAVRERQRAQAGELTARQHQYVADMNLVQQVWEQGNLERSQGLLRAHIPKPGKTDLRGLEWRYLWRLCQDESLKTIKRGNTNSVWRLTSSPNHSFVAGAEAGGLTLFDGSTGRALQKINVPRNGPDPGNWDTRLACAAGATNLLATLTGDNSVILLDVAGKSSMQRFWPHGSDRIVALALSPNGRLLATMTESDLKCWDISGTTNLPATPLWVASGLDASLTVTFSPDSQTVVALAKSTEQGSLGAWEARTGRELAPFPKEHVGYVFAAVFTPDGRVLAASGWDGRIVLWDFAKRRVKAVLVGHVGGVRTMDISGDGHRLISAGYDNTIRIWDLEREKQIGIRRGHRDQTIESIAFSADARTILSTTGAEIKLWNAEAGETLDAVDSGYTFANIALSPDGQWAVVVSLEKDCPPQVWEVATRSKKFELSRIEDHATLPRFSPDGHWFGVGSEDRKVRLWNARAWTTTKSAAEPEAVLSHDFEANYLAFSPDSKILAVAGVTFVSENPSHATNRLAFWDLGSRRRLRLFQGAGTGATETNAASSVEFSNDGRLVAVGFRDGAVRLWDLPHERLLKEFQAHAWPLDYGVHTLSFSADGHWLASGAGATMVLYDLEQLKALPAVRAHTAGVCELCFAADNKTLISAGNEGRLKFWNLATGKVALTLRHSDGPNAHIGLTTDGNLLASVDAHGILKFWPMASFGEMEAGEEGK
jgi:WD40 repeat protein/tRNA A-37 threonylcarbamoyl transferase component Bud32